MKRKIVLTAVAGLLFAVPTVFAEKSIALNFNGSGVADPKAYIADNGSAYVTVDTFAAYYGAKVEWNPKSNVLKLNGTVVSDTYGAPDAKGGTASIRALTYALGGVSSQVGWDHESRTVNATILPEGTIMVSPVVPQMGEHWANPKDLPLGPIYGVYNGKLVFLEYMPAKDLDKTVHDVPGTLVPTPAKIDHFDIDWNPEGHEGYLVPHYDMHLYYISREEQDKIMPAGMDSMSGHDH
ncbi:hypothetical protein [Paenibacillus beijingensis]|uniref:hypothetical protein n=1 Tax=Paenibacillus beijingensis TaxID=1126833 RepID=UPI000AB6F850|nr:hypothetical protein [Paenibacillus beijingensis]